MEDVYTTVLESIADIMPKGWKRKQEQQVQWTTNNVLALYFSQVMVLMNLDRGMNQPNQC